MSLRYGILGLLNREPMTGYNLKKLFDQTLNNVWTASLSQIYRELTILEKDGLVTSEIREQDLRPDKKIYTITEDGKQSFQTWLMQSPGAFVSPKRDEFMLRMFFGSAMGAGHVKEQLARFAEDRKRANEEMEKNMLKFQKQAADFLGGSLISAEEKKYVRFIVRRVLLTNRLLIDWAEECISELEDSKH
jgi:PadR family transcriptional regulator, regulatory protein AphA